MCWIDYVMSSVPKAELDVDLVEAEDYDNDYDLGLRQKGTFFSFNKFTQKQCGEWTKNHPDLEYKINYFIDKVKEVSASDVVVKYTEI